MVELGKLIHTHHPSLSIIILIIPSPSSNSTSTVNKYINTTTTTTSSMITFHQLPANVIPPDFSSDHFDRSFGIPQLYNPLVHHTLLSISHKSTMKAVILDFFTNAAFQVSKNQLNLPTYYLFTGGASLMCIFLNIPAIQNHSNDDVCFDFPGVPPFPASDLPQIILAERNFTNSASRNFLNTSINMANSSGLILNTFMGFEQRAVDALRAGGGKPPVYLVGPLINAQPDPAENECLKWLNSQPSKSVVFLCFGSMGVFSKTQLKEIAVGLERSEQRFLWVVRDPPPDELSNSGDVDDFLPQGFLSRTREKGLVVKNWAPQQAILSHGSVGGFVSHCGWNSILESMVAGVPMVAWPLYAEQKLNRVYLVQELKVAVAVKMIADDFVTAEAVEEKVRELMAGEEGEAVRERALEMSRRAKDAVEDGGPSHVEFFKLTQPWIVH